jgi:hypothetical protein
MQCENHATTIDRTAQKTIPKGLAMSRKDDWRSSSAFGRELESQEHPSEHEMELICENDV